MTPVTRREDGLFSAVGETEQPLGVFRVFRVRRDAAAGRQQAIGAWDADQRHCLAHLLGELERAGFLGIRQQHEEFFAAITTGKVALADNRAEDVADSGERLVALLVPKCVVDLLEVVEVDHDARSAARPSGWPAQP